MRQWLSVLGIVLLVVSVCTPAIAQDLSPLVAQEDTDEPLENGGEDEGQGEELPGVFINDIIIEGNTVIDTETLNKIIEAFKGRELSLEEMSELTDLLTMTYQEKGYILARAYLPEQEIEDGILKVSIAEGKIGKIKIAGYTHYRADVLKRYFKQQEKHGVVQESLLEKGLLLSSDTPDVKTTVVLKEGEEPGEVDVVLDVKDTSQVTFGVDLSLDYNNFGSSTVGEDRYGASVGIVDHVFGTKLDLRMIASGQPEDSYLGNYTWTIPVNTYGTKVSLNYLHSNFSVGQDLQDLGLGGRSEFYGGVVTHPILKKKNMNFSFNAGYSYKYTKNTILSGQSETIDEVDQLSFGFNYDSLDRYLGKNIAWVGYLWGEVDRDDTLNTSRTNTEDQSYDKIMGNFARIQKIYGYTNLMVRMGGQYTDKRLLPFEMFAIGGYGSVRGYDPSLFLGDSGYNVSAELMFAPPLVAEKIVFGQRLAQLMQFAVFADHGQVWITDALSDELSSQYLTGYGLGVRLFYKDKFTFKYDLGIPKHVLPDKPSAFHYFQGSVTLF
jgi:hemolysin activation/secretion protein